MIHRLFPVFSFILLMLHRFRAGDLWGVAVWFTFLLLLLVPWGWNRYACALALGAGFYVWLRASHIYVAMRILGGQPWERLFLILTSVAALTLLSAFLLTRKEALAWYPSACRNDVPLFLVFCLVAGSLYFVCGHPRHLLLVDRFFPGAGPWQALLMGIYAAELARRMLPEEGSFLWRPRLWALFSFVFFFQLLLGLAGFSLFLMDVSGEKLHLPVPALVIAGPLFRGEGLFMPILFLSTLVLVGSAWCSHLCYVGAWDDLASRRAGRPQPLPPGMDRLRWSILLLIIGIPLILRYASWSAWQGGLLAALFGLFGVGIMLGLSRQRGMMMHCRVWCPLGLLANLLGRLSPWRIRFAEHCHGCGACSQRCRYGALEAEDLQNRRPGYSCTLCGDCLTACQQDALFYYLPLLSARSARTLFICLVVSLHSVFLALARV